jgi:3-oxoacyl-[acyl-carrier protein] reductase
MLLQGKKALITGGSGGIGAALVRAFVLEGARVAFSYHRSEAAAMALVKELGTDNVVALPCDGADATSVAEGFQAALQFLGGMDILVNNAGITRDSLLLRLSEQDWDDVMDTNLKSVFLFTKQALRPMLRTGGSIINMSSVVGISGNAGQANYAASKAGIIAFSKSVAKEMGSRNIRCNVLAPGFVATTMTEALPSGVLETQLRHAALQRIGQPEEIAQAAVFLASDKSSYISGQVLSVCGGLNM